MWINHTEIRCKIDEKTVDTVFDMVKTEPERQTDLSNQLDTKMVQLFQAASVVIGLAGFATGAITKAGPVIAILLMISLGVYAITASLVFVQLLPKRFQTLNAPDLWNKTWNQDPMTAKRAVIDYSVDAFKHNKKKLWYKAWYLRLAIITTTIQVILVGLALILARLI